MNPTTIASQQYFPTYQLDNEDRAVALKEYEAATRTLDSDERIFSSATAILFVSVSAVTTLLTYQSTNLSAYFAKYFGEEEIVILTLFLVVLLSILGCLYFAERYRSIVYASRKVIVLRRMLGLSYGSIELILPSDRVEGANKPYHVKMFHGWTSYKSIPFYFIAIPSALIFLFELISYENPIKAMLGVESILAKNQFRLAAYFVSACWLVFLLIVYRHRLMDQYENWIRIRAQFAARLLGVPLISNFEYIVYRARLSVIEANRLNVGLSNLQPIVIILEDRRFYSHGGTSFPAMAAALWRFVKRGKVSGGSTVTQQLARSLFIRRLDQRVRRKIIESILARWLESMFLKTEILEMYICGVRYERGVIGIHEAMKHFFRVTRGPLTAARSFFLIERISNIRSRLLVGKIVENLRAAWEMSALQETDFKEYIAIVRKQAAEGRVIASESDLDSLQAGTEKLLARDEE